MWVLFKKLNEITHWEGGQTSKSWTFILFWVPCYLKFSMGESALGSSLYYFAFLMTVTKYLTRGHLRKDWFPLAPGLRLQSNMVGKTWWYSWQWWHLSEILKAPVNQETEKEECCCMVFFLLLFFLFGLGLTDHEIVSPTLGVSFPSSFKARWEHLPRPRGLPPR